MQLLSGKDVGSGLPTASKRLPALVTSSWLLFFSLAFAAASAPVSAAAAAKGDGDVGGGRGLGTRLHPSGTPWATAAQEAQDELNDPLILQSVIESVEQWERNRRTPRARRDTAIGNEESSSGTSTICYDRVGCFRDSGYLDVLPASPAEVDTRFLVYSVGEARSERPTLELSFENVTEAEKEEILAAIDPELPTKVIVHGFGSSCSHVWVYEMRSALMTVEDCNVVCVDWARGAAVPNYVRAAANTRLVGRQLAALIDALAVPLDRVHLIGFSLGAHVAGFAGATLGNISRITGLDPAGPLFESQDARYRLDATDAHFVDVIHSNGENLVLGGLGSWQPMGHADFYPNGGRMQKGCSNLFLGALSDFIWAGEVEGRSLCNHRRAYKFFTDSVSPRCLFPAFPCPNYEAFLAGECFPCQPGQVCPEMGYYADRSSAAKGTLYLITREEEPFCAHQYFVEIESGPADPPVTTFGRIQLTLVGSGVINETFQLTEKDDTELKSGGTLGKFTVPHPALQDPVAAELIYTAYSGWVSSGLKRWPVLRLSVTDSFGNSISVCRRDLMLETGQPVHLPLYPGKCHVPEEPTANATAEEEPTAANRSHENDHLNDRNRYLSADSAAQEENRLDDSRSFKEAFSEPDHLKNSTIAEPVLNKRVSHQPIEEVETSRRKPEIREPVLKPRHVRQYWTSDNESNAHSSTTSAPSMVQLLPERLVHLLARAEALAGRVLQRALFSTAPTIVSSMPQSTLSSSSSSPPTLYKHKIENKTTPSSHNISYASALHILVPYKYNEASGNAPSESTSRYIPLGGALHENRDAQYAFQDERDLIS